MIRARHLLQIGFLGLVAASSASGQATPATAPATKPAAVTDTDLRDPKSAMAAFGGAMLRGDADAALAAAVGDDGRKDLIRQYTPVIGSLRSLSDAATAKWGRENVLTKAVLGRTIAVELEGADVKINGEKATVTPQGRQQGFDLVRQGGLWKVNLDQLPVQQMEMALQMAPVLTAAAKETATEILADRYANAPAAQEAFTGKVLAGMLASPPAK
jgi:hypothetical protein